MLSVKVCASSGAQLARKGRGHSGQEEAGSRRALKSMLLQCCRTVGA